MKRSFFQAAVVSDTAIWMAPHGRLRSGWRGGWTGNYTRMLRAVLNKSWRTTPHETPTIRTLAPHHKKLYKFGRTRHAGHCWRSKDELISDVLLWTPTSWMCKCGDDQHELTYSSYVRTRVVILKTCREAMSDREKWREDGQGYPRRRRDMMMMMIYIYYI